MTTALEQERGADLDPVPTLLRHVMAGDSLVSISSSITCVSRVLRFETRL